MIYISQMSVLLKSPVKTAKERAETYERKHSDWSIGVPPRELPAVWNGFDGVQMVGSALVFSSSFSHRGVRIYVYSRYMCW